MDDSGSRPRESVGHDNPEGKSDRQDNLETALAAISVAIRGLPLDDELRPFAKPPDTPAVGAGLQGMHPDAEEVLAHFRRKFESPVVITQAAVQEVYGSLLKGRQIAYKLDRMLREHSLSLVKLLAEINARCVTTGDDVVHVWHKAARRDPENALTSFSFGTLWGAQHDVAVERRRSDAKGAGAAHWDDKDIRERAIGLLGEALGLPETELLKLELDCYHPAEGAILLKGSDRRMVLSDRTRLAMNAWLKVREPGGNDLFPAALPRCPREYAIGGNSKGFWNAIAAQDDCEERNERQDELEGLLPELDTNARALICSRMQDEGGNWSIDCLEKLRDHQPVDAASPDPGEHNAKLTKQQVQTAQKQICEARRRQLARRKGGEDDLSR